MGFQFFERRRERRWHQSVESTARASRSAASHDGPVAGRVLPPRAQLQTHTKSLLANKHWMQDHKDKKLENLIQLYVGPKEEAFAACVAELSPEAIDRYLRETSKPTSLQGLKSWLRAFICAAQSHSDVFTASDALFALAILPAAGQTAQTVHVAVRSNAGELFNAWRKVTPSYPLLLRWARALTQEVILQIARDLGEFQSELSEGGLSHDSLVAATEYQKVLSEVGATTPALATQLDENLSRWRQWAAWEFDAMRLGRWTSISPNAPFNALLALEGPDLDSLAEMEVCSNAWKALIRDGRVFSWLESRGFLPGVGLLTGDTQDMLTAFFKEFLEVASLSVQKRKTKVLKYLIDRDGLDLQSLKAWRSIDTFLLEPHIVTLLLPSDEVYPATADTTMIQCLRTLSRDVTGAARTPLVKEVARTVVKVHKVLLDNFNNDSLQNARWKDPTIRLWRLREAIASSGWLHFTLESPGFDAALVLSSRLQAPERSIEVLRTLQSQIVDRPSDLIEPMEDYIRSYVQNGRCVPEEVTALPMALHDLWMSRLSSAVRDSILLIAVLDGLDEMTKLACIKRMQTTTEATAQRLRRSLNAVVEGDTMSIVQVTDVISTLCAITGTTEHWKDLLKTLIERLGICIWVHDQEFLAMGLSKYRFWITQLYSVVGDTLDQVAEVHAWLVELQQFDEAIQALEQLTDSSAAMKSIMKAYNDPDAKLKHTEMLGYLTYQKDGERLEMMQNLYLMIRSSALETVWQTLRCLDTVSNLGFASCQQLMEQCRQSCEIASVRLTIWLRTPQVQSDREEALFYLGKLLKLIDGTENHVPTKSLQLTKKFYQKRVAKIVETTQRLEQVRVALRRKEATQVQVMVKELGLEQLRGLEALIDDLPADLHSFVDQTADDVIELSFPLSDPYLNTMQRLAFGLSGTETLSVYLRIADGSKVDGFCVHVHGTSEHGGDTSEAQHSFYDGDAKTQPMKSYCHGEPSRLSYMVSIALWHILQIAQHDPMIKKWYQAVMAVVKSSGRRCMICIQTGSVGLHRPAVCGRDACQKQYLSSDLSMRLSDLRTDGRAVDLLLAAIFATAVGGNLALLPNCPDTITDTQKLVHLLNSLPATNQLASAPDLAKAIRRHGLRAQLLLSWACNSYRGFVITAQGRYRVPNMPGVHQFLLIDGNPEIESKFARQSSGQASVVLFHGTSLDRLYGILSQGLRVLSGTPLQKHGAARGPGVYTSNDPTTAWSYANATSSMHMSAFFRSRADFMNTGVVLGCESAGNLDAPGITVVPDETQLMVRYIFVVPRNTPCPRGQDIIGPMLSTFSYLRSTAAPTS